MTHAVRIVAAVAVLTALVLLNVSCETQTPEIDALRARAEQGDVRAQSRLGNMYHYGEVVPQDDAEAVRWSRLAAEQGDAWAQYHLGVMYTGVKASRRPMPRQLAGIVWRLSRDTPTRSPSSGPRIASAKASRKITCRHTCG